MSTAEMSPTAREPGDAGRNPFTQVPIEVIVSVGRARPLVAELLQLSQDAVLQLDKKIDDPVELYVGDRLIARGELIELGDGQDGQLGVRLTEVLADPEGGAR